MADATIPNLEPIEEKDLNTKEKFLGGVPVEKKTVNPTEARPEVKIEAPSAPEKVVERKEGQAEKEAAYSKILSKISTTKPVPAADHEIAADAGSISQENDAGSKIKNLVTIAETKGIPHAVKVAQHLEDNYALDEFHDCLLADELHDALVKKGLIKEY